MAKEKAVAKSKAKGGENNLKDIFVKISWWILILLFLQFFGILVLSLPNSVPVYASYLTLNPIASGLAGHSVLSFTSIKIFQISIVLIVELLLFIFALSIFYQISINRDNYIKSIKSALFNVRWVEFGFGSGLTLSFVSMMFGNYDVINLILILFFVSLSALGGYILERNRNARSYLKGIIFWASVICSFVPIFISCIYLLFSNLYGSSNVSAASYWAGIFSVIFLALFWNNIYNQEFISRQHDGVKSEKYYIVSNFAYKSLIIWVIFAGLLHN